MVSSAPRAPTLSVVASAAARRRVTTPFTRWLICLSTVRPASGSTTCRATVAAWILRQNHVRHFCVGKPVRPKTHPGKTSMKTGFSCLRCFLRDDIVTLKNLLGQLQLRDTRRTNNKHNALGPEKSPRRGITNSAPRNEQRWVAKTKRQPY